jgi:hypothetical protein
VVQRGFVFVGSLVALLAAACSDKERCQADKSLAEVCADGHCPKDFAEAIARGLSCDVDFHQVWRDGRNGAVGMSSGYGARIYYFEGQQPVGYETYTDQLDANESCPSRYVNGQRSLVPYRYVAGSVEPCTPCPNYVSDELPLCTDAELE